MLAHIKGELAAKQIDYVVIDVGGLGYKVFMSSLAIDNIKSARSDCEYYFNVEDDDMDEDDYAD